MLSQSIVFMKQTNTKVACSVQRVTGYIALSDSFLFSRESCLKKTNDIHNLITIALLNHLVVLFRDIHIRSNGPTWKTSQYYSFRRFFNESLWLMSTTQDGYICVWHFHLFLADFVCYLPLHRSLKYKDLQFKTVSISNKPMECLCTL